MSFLCNFFEYSLNHSFNDLKIAKLIFAKKKPCQRFLAEYRISLDFGLNCTNRRGENSIFEGFIYDKNYSKKKCKWRKHEQHRAIKSEGERWLKWFFATQFPAAWSINMEKKLCEMNIFLKFNVGNFDC